MQVCSNLTSDGAWLQSDGTPHMTDINHDIPQSLQENTRTGSPIRSWPKNFLPFDINATGFLVDISTWWTM